MFFQVASSRYCGGRLVKNYVNWFSSYSPVLLEFIINMTDAAVNVDTVHYKKLYLPLISCISQRHITQAIDNRSLTIFIIISTKTNAKYNTVYIHVRCLRTVNISFSCTFKHKFIIFLHFITIRLNILYKEHRSHSLLQNINKR